MVWTFREFSSNNIIFPLNDTDDFFIIPDRTASTTNNNAVVVGAGGEHHVLVYGTLRTSIASTVVLGVNPNADFGNLVEVAAGGLIISLSEGNAVFLFGNNPTILNEGMISSSGAAVRIQGNLASTATVTNSGMLLGDEFGIVNDGVNPLSIRNSGMISTRLMAIDASDAADTVINTGRIIGEIRLDGGNDRYDGSTGLLTGRLFAGAGNDTIIGGRLGETIDGGAGNDLITGGLGKDSMTGGANNDTFRFLKGHSVNGSRADIITDFDKSGNDRIDVSTLFGPRMAFIGDDAFTRAGQVRINDVAGPNVIVEINTGGSLAPDVSIRLLKTTFASMTASDFIL